jgi:Tfp pilus assembly protein PilO
VTRGGRGRIAVVAGAAAFLLLNVAFYMTYASSTGRRRAALEARRGQLAGRVAESSAEAGRLQAQREKLSGVHDAVEEFYGRRVGSREATLAPIVEEIHMLLRRNGAVPTQISYDVEPLEGLPLSRMRIGFSFRGDYGAFKRFLRDVAASKRWLSVQEASVARDPELPGAVEVRIAIATYFSGEDPNARPAPARASAGRPLVETGGRP